MPRYVVERIFPDGLRIPVDAEGAQLADTYSHALVDGRAVEIDEREKC